MPSAPCATAGVKWLVIGQFENVARRGDGGPAPARQAAKKTVNVKGGEKPDQRAEQNTATAAVGVRWSEGVGMRPGAVSAGNEGRA